MPPLEIRPFDNYVTENLLLSRRLDRQALERIKASPPPAGGDTPTTLSEALLQRGVLSIRELSDLADRYRQLQQALDSGYRGEDLVSPGSETSHTAAGLEGGPSAQPSTSQPKAAGEDIFARTKSRHVRDDLAATMHLDRSEMDDDLDLPPGLEEMLDPAAEATKTELPRDMQATISFSPEELGIKPRPEIEPEGEDDEFAQTFRLPGEELPRAEVPQAQRVAPPDESDPFGVTAPAEDSSPPHEEPVATQVDAPGGVELERTMHAEDPEETLVGGLPRHMADTQPEGREVDAPTDVEAGEAFETYQVPPLDSAETARRLGEALTLRDETEEFQDTRREREAETMVPPPSSAAPPTVVSVSSEAPLNSVSVLGASAAGLLALSSQLREGRVDISALLTREELDRIQLSRTQSGEVASIVGEVLGGHVIIDKIGRGGMGEVYLAKQLSLGRYVALKILPDRIARDARLVEKFVYEANLLARVNHTNVVKVYDVQATPEGRMFFTMEYISGRPLNALIEQEGPMPLEAAINVIKQCCRALARVKKEGLTHRDIKPGNILLDDQGVAKVVDFGLAEMTQALSERTEGHAAGTPYYMPPEALNNEPATHLSDQYSLGATFYHLLAGEPPFTGRDLPTIVKKHLEAPVPRVSSANTLVPSAIDGVIQRMMAKDPAKRYPSFRAVFEALEAVESKLGLQAAPEVFLADKLVDLAAANVRGMRAKMVAWALVGLGSVYSVIGLNALAWKYLEVGPATFLMDWSGNAGLYLVTVAYLIILYIGSVRKRLLPAWGSIRRWLQLHMLTAFIGSMLVIYHSGNFLRDYLPLSEYDRSLVKPVALLPLVNSVVLMLIVISGLIGRYIYTDLHRQLQLERLAAKGRDEEEGMSPHMMTMLVISHRFLAFWRVLHYPLTIVFFLLAALHVVTIMFYGGPFGAVPVETLY